MLRSVFRFAIGCAIGLLLWWYGTPLYGQFISRVARACLASSSKFAGVALRVSDRHIDVFGGTLPPAQIPFDQLTYNVVLLLGLFATVPGIWKDRNVGRLIAAIAFLSVTHVLATVINVMATYATRLGVWSNQHFNGFEQDLWTAADYTYRLAGMFAIAFACWYFAVQPSVARKAA